MKIERLKGKRTKQIILVSLVFIGIVVTLVLITSKAKYKNVQSIDLASGTINYTPADIDIVAINVENDAGEYDSVEVIPTTGYVLSDTSYCNVNGSKDTSVILTYENGKVGVNNITKKVKCYLYFDKIKGEVIVDKIKAQSKGEKTDFTGIATSADTGIYSAPDDYGTSYYFRGLEGSLNNWVKYAGFYWRIIRINGNGTIRVIYQGEAKGMIANSNKIGETTQIGKFMFNHTDDDNTYVGYMNYGASTSNYVTAHQNKTNSIAKTEIEKWYQNSIANNEEYLKNVDINTGFCNDREIASNHSNYTGSGYGKTKTAYKAVDRILATNLTAWKTTQTPTLQCANKERDLFTVNNANTENKGNKKLTYPVGLITSDEIVFAGGFGGKDNSTYYLYTNQSYYTMSPYAVGNKVNNPSYTYADNAFIFANNMLGSLDVTSVISDNTSLRPIINLRADTKFTGDGSETNPFVVV